MFFPVRVQICVRCLPWRANRLENLSEFRLWSGIKSATPKVSLWLILVSDLLKHLWQRSFMVHGIISTCLIKTVHSLSESLFCLARGSFYEPIFCVVALILISLLCLGWTGSRFSCWSPPELVTVNEWQQLSRKTLSAALTVCVCARVRVSLHVCEIQEELQSEQSHWGISLLSSLLSSLPQPLASFQFPPFSSLVLSIHDSSCGFLYPGSLGNCRTALSWLAGCHCKESRAQEAGEREQSWDSPIDFFDTEKKHRG